jgi:hypothetical protein
MNHHHLFASWAIYFQERRKHAPSCLALLPVVVPLQDLRAEARVKADAEPCWVSLGSGADERLFVLYDE